MARYPARDRLAIMAWLAVAAVLIELRTLGNGRFMLKARRALTDQPGVTRRQRCVSYRRTAAGPHGVTALAGFIGPPPGTR